MDVYFQNMTIKSFDFASQAAIKSQKVIVYLEGQFLLKMA